MNKRYTAARGAGCVQLGGCVARGHFHGEKTRKRKAEGRRSPRAPPSRAPSLHCTRATSASLVQPALPGGTPLRCEPRLPPLVGTERGTFLRCAVFLVPARGAMRSCATRARRRPRAVVAAANCALPHGGTSQPEPQPCRTRTDVSEARGGRVEPRVELAGPRRKADRRGVSRRRGGSASGADTQRERRVQGQGGTFARACAPRGRRALRPNAPRAVRENAAGMGRFLWVRRRREAPAQVRGVRERNR